MDVWDEAVQFLLIGDRARQLAERHPLTADGCSSCARPGCVAARMAVAALELLEQRERLRSERDRSATRLDQATTVRLHATMRWLVSTIDASPRVGRAMPRPSWWRKRLHPIPTQSGAPRPMT